VVRQSERERKRDRGAGMAIAHALTHCLEDADNSRKLNTNNQTLVIKPDLMTRTHGRELRKILVSDTKSKPLLFSCIYYQLHMIIIYFPLPMLSKAAAAKYWHKMRKIIRFCCKISLLAQGLVNFILWYRMKQLDAYIPSHQQHT